MPMITNYRKGFTLVELLVALGLFATIMAISSGAYLIMISATRDAQAITTGINSLSYALDSMARTINTGSGYFACGTNSSTFSFTDQYGTSIRYDLEGSNSKYKLTQTIAGNKLDMTDPSVVITSPAVFNCFNTVSWTNGDSGQASVIMILQGTVDVGHGHPPEPFSIQTTAAMRGTDL